MSIEARPVPRFPLEPLLTCWAVPGWAFGLLVAVDASIRNRPYGLQWNEIAAVVFVNSVIAGLIFGAGAGLVAWVVAVVIGKARVAAEWRFHIALAAGTLLGWLTYGTSFQADLTDGRRSLLRLGAPVVGLGLAVLLFGVAKRLPRVVGAARPLRIGTRAMLAIAILASAVSTVLFVWGRGSTPEAAAGEPVGIADTAPRFPVLVPRLEAAPGRGRLVVLGIDGLDWKILEPLLAAGELPNFARIRAEGASAVLNTMRPTASPRIWTTVATGRTPEDHGIVAFDVLQYPRLGIERLFLTRALNYTRPILDLVSHGWRKPISSQERKVKALWNLCSEAGISVGVVGWWATWPAERTAGFIVSDHAYYDSMQEKINLGHIDFVERGAETYPEGLLAELAPLQRPVADARPEDLERFARLTDEDRAQFSQRIAPAPVGETMPPLHTMTLGIFKDSYYGASALRLADQRRPQVLLAYFNAVDLFAHAVYPFSVAEAAELGYDEADIERFGDSMNEVVRWIDEWLGRFVERMDDEATLVVLSDHGYARETHQGQVTYNHRDAPPGVFIAAGHNVRQGIDLGEVEMFDIAPTLFHLVGLPLSDELAGRPLVEALEPAFLAASPPLRTATYEAGPPSVRRSTSGEDEEMLRNLRGLGYIQ